MRILIAMASAVSLAASAAAEVPVPRAKPGAEALQPLAVMLAPLPRQKPYRSVEPDSPPPDAAAGPAPAWPRDTASWSRNEAGEARAECQRLLADLNITWSPLSSIGGPGRCGIAAPIEVSAIAGAEIKPPALLNCRMAAALHAWISGTLQPAARKKLGARVSVIRNASSYACRRRNNSRSGKISEHAFGNAFDMSDFEFSKGTEVSVKGDWSGVFQLVGLSSRGNFLRQVRKAACSHFTTVLGPGSDRAHGDHFHVDLAQRRSGYRICK